jgi:hypothetical protein
MGLTVDESQNHGAVTTLVRPLGHVYSSIAGTHFGLCRKVGVSLCMIIIDLTLHHIFLFLGNVELELGLLGNELGGRGVMEVGLISFRIPFMTDSVG